MTRTVIVDVLLGAGVLLLLLCAAGIVLMRSAYDRLHYSNAASWGALLVAVAILVRESWSLIGDKALAAAFVMAVCSPAIAHATARAGRIRERGAWNASHANASHANTSYRNASHAKASHRNASHERGGSR